MIIIKSFLTGARDSGKLWKMLGLFYFFNILTAILLSLPFRNLLMKFFGHSLASETLAQGFNFNLMLEFINVSGSSLGTVLSISSYFILMYLFLNTFLIGGALQIFNQNTHEFSLANFFEGCGKYFSRFIHLFLFFLISLIVLFLVNFMFSRIIKALTGETANESVFLWTRSAKWIIMFILFLIVNMIFDYAKILTVRHDHRSMYRVILEAGSFVYKHKSKTVSLYFLVFLVGMIFLLVYWSTSNVINPSSALTIFLLFVVQQFYIFSKIWVKMIFYAAQLNLTDLLSEAPGEIPGEEDPGEILLA